MNVLEAMKEVKKERCIERKLGNGITEVKDFHGNGQICQHYFLNENGKLHGEFKWRREDGTLGVHSNYKNGKYHGEYKSWWWEDGKLCEHELYEDGELIEDYLI